MALLQLRWHSPRLGRMLGGDAREIFVNLWHGVTFCDIFLVIVKLGGVSRVIECDTDAEGQMLVHPQFPFVSVSFGAVPCHFVVLERIGRCAAVCS